MSTLRFRNPPLFQSSRLLANLVCDRSNSQHHAAPLRQAFNHDFNPQEGRRRGEEDRGARNIQHVLFINEHQEEDDSRTHTNTHSPSLMHAWITLAVF